MIRDAATRESHEKTVLSVLLCRSSKCTDGSWQPRFPTPAGTFLQMTCWAFQQFGLAEESPPPRFSWVRARKLLCFCSGSGVGLMLPSMGRLGCALS